jgi:seryl-tRNA synthetase
MPENITDPQEFWNALGRLYDSTLELKATTEELRATTEELRSTTEEHSKQIGALAQVAETLLAVSSRHEKRLDYSEVVNVAIQDDLRGIRAELRAIRDKLERPSGE